MSSVKRHLTPEDATVDSAPRLAAYCVVLGIFQFIGQYARGMLDPLYKFFNQTWIFVLAPIGDFGIAVGPWTYRSVFLKYFTIWAWIYGIIFIGLGVAAYNRFSPNVKWAANAFFATNITIYWLLTLFWNQWTVGEFLVGSVLYTLLMLAGIGLGTIWLDTPAAGQSRSSTSSPETVNSASTTSQETETTGTRELGDGTTEEQEQVVAGSEATTDQSTSGQRISKNTDDDKSTAPAITASGSDPAETETMQSSDSESTEAQGGTGEHDTEDEIASDSEVNQPLETPVADADEELIGRLIDLLQSEDGAQRKAAVEKLGEIAVERPSLVEPAVEELQDLRLDPNPEVSRAASDVFDQLPDDFRF